MPGLMINFRYSAKGYNTWFQWGMTMIYFDVKQKQTWKQKNKYEEAIS